MIDKMTEDQILLLIIKCLKEMKKDKLHEIIEELQPYDIAKLYKDMPEKYRRKFLLFLSSEQIADLLQELEHELQLDILHKLGIDESSKVMNEMDNDDLADLLNELSADKIKEFIGILKDEKSQKVRRLMEYPPDTAGGIMTDRYVWIRTYYTVREAIEKLKTFADIAENIYYLYVLDENKKLVGVVSYRDLLLADLDDKIEDIMFTRVISVPVDMDQEEVAKIIEKYDFIAVPVVDKENHMVGIVTVDDIIDVVIQEANEDIEKFSASGRAIDFNTPALTAAVRRLPWLVLLLFIGLITGSIVSIFEDTLQTIVALAFFMPLIAGMTGNTGTQSLAIVVRGLIAHELDFKSAMRLIWREFNVSIIIGVCCGLLVFTAAYIWKEDMMLSLVVGSSLFFTLIIGTLAGTVIPIVLYKLKVDPAVASGPLITTLNDIFSLSIYFGLATFFLSHML